MDHPNTSVSFSCSGLMDRCAYYLTSDELRQPIQIVCETNQTDNDGSRADESPKLFGFQRDSLVCSSSYFVLDKNLYLTTQLRSKPILTSVLTEAAGFPVFAAFVFQIDPLPPFGTD